MKRNKINKKINKNHIFIALAITLIFAGCLSFTGFDFATLYGGSNIDSVGGNVSYSANSVSGNQQILFSELSTDELTIQITNNGQISQGKVLPLTFNSAATLTEYQKDFTLDYQTGMQSDFSDIKFETTDGKRVPYFIESYIADTSAVVWIRADFATGDTVINCIYDNGFTVSESNAEEVFLSYFDGDPTGWTEVDPNSHISFINDRLEFTNLPRNEAAYVYQPVNVPNEWKSEWTLYKTSSANTAHVFGFGVSSVIDDLYANSGDSIGISHYYGTSVGHQLYIFESDDGSTSNVFETTSSTNTHYMTAYRLGNTVTVKRFSDSARTTEIDSFTKDVSGITGLQYSYLISSLQASGTESVTGWIDDHYLMKYASSEPTISFGTPTTYDGFQKSKTLTITSTEAIDGYQYKFTLPYDSDMQVDMDDIRFRYTNGVSIPYFTESVTDSTVAIVWLKVDLIDGDTDVEMLYGNSNFVSDSNSNEVFIFYEDCETGSFADKWNNIVGASGSYATTVDYGTSLKINGDSGEAVVSSKITTDEPAIFEAMVKIIGGAGNSPYSCMFNARTSPSANTFYSFRPSNMDTGKAELYKRISGTFTTLNEVSNTNAINVWAKWTISIDENGNIKTYYNDVLKNSATDTSITNGGIGGRNIGDTGLNIYMDNIIIRKYISSEPSISFGTETSLTNPTMTISCTGDSDVHEYIISEVRDITLYPSSAISQIDITSNSANYDYDISFNYSQSASEIEQTITNTTGFKEIQFTPNAPLTSGYVNINFTDLNFSNYTVTVDSAYLDTTEITNIQIDNNTVSLQIGSIDSSLHTANCTVSYSIPSEPDTPTVPTSSSSGGGGSTYIPPVVEEETIDEEIIEENTEIINPANLEKSDVTDLLGEDKNTYLIIILFVIVSIIIGMNLRKR